MQATPLAGAGAWGPSLDLERVVELHGAACKIRSPAAEATDGSSSTTLEPVAFQGGAAGDPECGT